MKNIGNKTAWAALAFVLAWCAASWLIARSYYLSRTDDLIRQETQVAAMRAQDLMDGASKNLKYLSGAADLLAHQQSIRRALSSPLAASRSAPLPGEAGVRRWTADPVLHAVSKELEAARGDLTVDVIAVANAAGTIVAASNWNDSTSGVGHSIADREYFRASAQGLKSTQIAVGKVSNVPGIFFSTPVMADSRFLGAVVVKVNLASLSFLIKQTDTFVTDRHGVILMADDPNKELLALPGAPVNAMSAPDRMALYRKSELPELRMSAWGDGEFRSLVRVMNEPLPHILLHKELPDFGLTVHVERELSELLELQEDRLGMFWLVWLSGGLLILLMSGIFLHLRATSLARREVEFQAHYDMLTRLPNRRLLMNLLQEEIARADRSRGRLALLMIDLDGFKEVNDTMGHNVGDALLAETAARIQHCVGESGTVTRFGGDEFVVILPDFPDPERVERTARCILEGLAKPFFLAQEAAYISASIGIVRYPDHAGDTESLLKYADQAMYAAKHAGRNQFFLYAPSLEETAQTRRALIKELRQALPMRQLHVYYQPIVELKTGALHKAEALVRWHHPARGVVGPAEFIPVAESAGMISEIGDWVFRQAARQAMLWRDQYDPRFQISVNKSPAQFRDPISKQADAWLAHLEQHDLAGDSICVEITEGLLLHAEDGIKDRLLKFSEKGIQVSIDDFGTGYSSLSYLKKFDIDYLKIDKSFICDLATDYDNLVLCEAIITMAHNLGLKVIAEGVETLQQRDILARFDCDYAQGYLFSRPVPAEDFEKLFASRGQQRAKVSPLLRLVN